MIFSQKWRSEANPRVSIDMFRGNSGEYEIACQNGFTKLGTTDRAEAMNRAGEYVASMERAHGCRFVRVHVDLKNYPSEPAS